MVLEIFYEWFEQFLLIHSIWAHKSIAIVLLMFLLENLLCDTKQHNIPEGQSNNNLHTDLINVIVEKNQVLVDTIKSCDPFNCDGLIVTPLNGDREIKIKWFKIGIHW